MTVIDTPEGIEMVGLLTLAHAIALEINTGMTMSRGLKVLNAAAARGYTGPTRGTVKNKGLALRWTLTQILERRGDYLPSTSIARALEATA